MRMRVLFVMGMLALGLWASAQPQHEDWYMGFGAGLDFGSGVPVATGGPLSTDEGCATISDANGQLLFFTNGEQVWDRSLNLMPNGSGLLGHFSCSQSALIVPVPGQPEQFELFTAPAGAGEWTPSDAGHHHRIDMGANGGLGDVVYANQPLAAPLVEKLTATRHANGIDVWVLYHGWNNANYYAYLVTCEGVEGPVVSTLGYIPRLDDAGSSGEVIGCMKMNRQGTMLCSVWTEATLSTQQDYQSRGIVQLLDFDNSTGMLSNVRSDTLGTGTDIQKCYGVEFSPGGAFVYVNDHGLIGGISNSRVLQYDLAAPFDQPHVVAQNNRAYGSMQLGPDGAIHIARLNGATYLSAITAPDLQGAACGFVEVGASLGTDPSTWGLPNHWDTYPEAAPIDPIAWEDSLVCGDAEVLVEARYSHPFHVPTFRWSTGETTPSIAVHGSGTFTLEMQLPCTTIHDTVHIRRGGIPFELGNDLLICDDAEAWLEVPAARTIQWSSGDTGTVIAVHEAGLYSVLLIDTLGCTSRDSVLLRTRNCACAMYLPNAFSPNNDGINDRFTPVMDCDPERFDLELFDRWGGSLFRSTDPATAWEAEDVPVGVYAYRLNYAWNDGRIVQERTQRGHVTLVR
ncbi:MAG: gliding motility-associated C-terminal domain-containing protein [Flavobacteriales bacterium]|nr:gliding motility-associated C-terminal domain-containing protein [Flavobacteriales bacterium]